MGKSLDLDGFNIEFFQTYQDSLSGNIIDIFNRLFESKSLPFNWGRTFIVFILGDSLEKFKVYHIHSLM